MDQKTQLNKLQKRFLNELDVTRKDTIEFEVPGKSRRIVINISKRHYFDPVKQKIITDQTLHKAVYGRKEEKKKGE